MDGITCLALPATAEHDRIFGLSTPPVTTADDKLIDLCRWSKFGGVGRKYAGREITGTRYSGGAGTRGPSRQERERRESESPAACGMCRGGPEPTIGLCVRELPLRFPEDEGSRAVDAGVPAVSEHGVRFSRNGVRRPRRAGVRGSGTATAATDRTPVLHRTDSLTVRYRTLRDRIWLVAGVREYG